MTRALLPLVLALWAATPSAVVARVVTHTRLDFDGDGKTDAVILELQQSAGIYRDLVWHVLRSSDGMLSITQWGRSDDVPVPFDYDGDRKTDLSVWRSYVSGIAWWFTLQSSTGLMSATPWGSSARHFGAPIDDPRAAADFDGDGRVDLAVYRWPGGFANYGPNVWYVKRSSDGVIVGQPWGLSDDFPIDFPRPGDYDGDGHADFGAQRYTGGGKLFHLLQSSKGFAAIFFGAGGTAIGDYDGDGRDDLADIQSGSGLYVWYVRASSDDSLHSTVWGAPGIDRPTPGDYDGDGKLDVAVWRYAAHTFYILRSSDGGLTVVTWPESDPLGQYHYPIAGSGPFFFF